MQETNGNSWAVCPSLYNVAHWSSVALQQSVVDVVAYLTPDSDAPRYFATEAEAEEFARRDDFKWLRPIPVVEIDPMPELAHSADFHLPAQLGRTPAPDLPVELWEHPHYQRMFVGCSLMKSTTFWGRFIDWVNTSGRVHSVGYASETVLSEMWNRVLKLDNVFNTLGVQDGASRALLWTSWEVNLLLQDHAQLLLTHYEGTLVRSALVATRMAIDSAVSGFLHGGEHRKLSESTIDQLPSEPPQRSIEDLLRLRTAEWGCKQADICRALDIDTSDLRKIKRGVRHSPKSVVTKRLLSFLHSPPPDAQNIIDKHRMRLKRE